MRILDYRLCKQEPAQLGALHRRGPIVHEVYRINTLILLGNGRTVADVAKALLIDPETARTYFKRYKQVGLDELLRTNYIGSEGLLDPVQSRELDAHLQQHLHLTAESVARSVKERWGVCYAPSGLAAALRRLCYVYKERKLVLGKTDATAPEESLKDYEDLKNTDGKGDVVLCVDATHPQHNPEIGYGWIRRREQHRI